MPETVCWLLARGKETRAYMTAVTLNRKAHECIVCVPVFLDSHVGFSYGQFYGIPLFFPFTLEVHLNLLKRFSLRFWDTNVNKKYGHNRLTSI